MNGAKASWRVARPLIQGRTRRHLHTPVLNTGGICSAQPQSGLKNIRARPWPFGAYKIHNAVAVRNASFARSLPKLALKLARLPAMAGGAVIGGVAYLQYQANQAGTYAKEQFGRGWDFASGAAGSLYGVVGDVAERTKTGWARTTEKIEMPGWMQQITERSRGNSQSEGGGPEKDPPPPKQSRAGGATVAATGAAFGYSQSPEDDDRDAEEVAKDDQMMLLTKKMIEIRSILQVVGQSDTLILPSIVVIGSQSSGKSSVLEAIVGHEFLPKGSNMITRRPIELTLVSTPEAPAEYGEFPALGLGKITDFTQIQKILTDLNMAVPAVDCVSDDPIKLTISSPNVPDLSLIDLPGYIQVSGHDQPPELKQRISDLCDKYIQPPNVILAISAADVDLANSTALRASRRVDPRGERTIGVVTKMDLVDPQRGASILGDRKYPLRLGYVGVVSRIPPTAASLFSRGSGNITNAITKNENAYFSAHPLEFGPQSELATGTSLLRKKLMHVLEQTMAASLQGTSAAIHQELEEATYEFKVQYNDRPLSAESYLAESLDAFKQSFKKFQESFGRPQVREMLKEELDQRVLDLLAQRYWNKPVNDLGLALPEPDPLSEIDKADPESLYWNRKLDASTSALTKLGVGRLATTVVANSLSEQVDHLVSASTFNSHPFVREAIRSAASGILNERFYSTSDQVENCIKPFKFEVDVDDAEWAKGRANVSLVLKKELRACNEAVKRAESEIGGSRKMKEVLAYIERVQKGDIVLEGHGVGGGGGFSAALLAKGREALFLTTRQSLLKLRLAALKSKSCRSPSQKYTCPEPFLDAVASQLVATSVLFLNVELLSEFYYQFPRELDQRLGRGLSKEDVERFAREDPKVARHLDVVRRKELLELALEKMEGLQGLERNAGGRREIDTGNARGRERPRGDTKRAGWLF